MDAATLPYACRQPQLKVKKPKDGPGDDRLRQGPPWFPLAFIWKEEAQSCGFLLVDMRDCLTFGQQRQIWSPHEYLWTRKLSVVVFKPKGVLPGHRRRLR